MTLDQIVAWLNKTYPSRNWDQRCQQLVWNVIYYVMGYTRDSQMHTYATATAARLASRIESTDALAAPVGAIHYWRDPAEGHVAIEMGGGQVLMTGTPYALNGGVQRGNNYGTTTVAAYSRVRGNPYLGWARTNGANPTLIGKIKTNTPAPDVESLMEGDEMFIIILKNGRWYLVLPNGAGKMRATWLPGQSGATNSGIPRLDFSRATDEHMKQLRAAVDGI